MARAVNTCISYSGMGRKTVSNILDSIVSEITDNQAYYSQFADDDQNLIEEATQYVTGKKYMSGMASLIPNIISNAFNIEIWIITKKQNGFDITPTPPGRLEGRRPKEIIYLLRTGTGADAGTHYQSLISGKAITSNLKHTRHNNNPGEIKALCPTTGQKYLLFRSPSPLSNFYKTRGLVVNGTSFSSNEQNIQARRFPIGHQTRNAIMASSYPSHQKKIG